MSTISAKVPGLTAAQHAANLEAYQRDGAARAEAIGNRGPIRLDANDRLHPDILAAYNQHGFYVFEGAIGAPELEQLRADVLNMIDRAPVAPDSSVDAKGRPALGLDYARSPYRLAKPLSDPFGGTAQLGGRHPHQMEQPKAARDAPEYVPFIMYSMCEAMPSGLRLYGHPDLLTIAESINGPDFVPYNDAIFVKQPGLGASVSWHQDGVTHWDSPNWDSGMASTFRCSCMARRSPIACGLSRVHINSVESTSRRRFKLTAGVTRCRMHCHWCVKRAT